MVSNKVAAAMGSQSQVCSQVISHQSSQGISQSFEKKSRKRKRLSFAKAKVTILGLFINIYRLKRKKIFLNLNPQKFPQKFPQMNLFLLPLATVKVWKTFRKKKEIPLVLSFLLDWDIAESRVARRQTLNIVDIPAIFSALSTENLLHGLQLKLTGKLHLLFLKFYSNSRRHSSAYSSAKSSADPSSSSSTSSVVPATTPGSVFPEDPLLGMLLI